MKFKILTIQKDLISFELTEDIKKGETITLSRTDNEFNRVEEWIRESNIKVIEQQVLVAKKEAERLGKAEAENYFKEQESKLHLEKQELTNQIELLKKENQTSIEKAKNEFLNSSQYQNLISEKEKLNKELAELKANENSNEKIISEIKLLHKKQIDSLETQKINEKNNAINEFKQSNDYLDLVNKITTLKTQIQTIQENAINNFKNEKEYLNLVSDKNNLEKTLALVKQEKQEKEIKIQEISENYKKELNLLQQQKTIELSSVINEFKSSNEYVKLVAKISELETKLDLEAESAVNKFKNEDEYRNMIIDLQKKENLLKMKDEEIENYRRTKQGNSKVIGELFEDHCYQIIQDYFENFEDCKFYEKDEAKFNEERADILGEFFNSFKTSELNFTSLIECKTEALTTEKGTKNKSHYEKLIKRAKKINTQSKKPVYALLVSELEPEDKFWIRKIDIEDPTLNIQGYLLRHEMLVPFLKTLYTMNKKWSEIESQKENYQLKENFMDEFKLFREKTNVKFNDLIISCESIEKEIEKIETASSKVRSLMYKNIRDKFEKLKKYFEKIDPKFTKKMAKIPESQKTSEHLIDKKAINEIYEVE